MKLRTLKSRNLIPHFYVYLLKLREQNPAKCFLAKIVKLSTRKIKNQ